MAGKEFLHKLSRLAVLLSRYEADTKKASRLACLKNSLWEQPGVIGL
jgi:hypothetical protein